MTPFFFTWHAKFLFPSSVVFFFWRSLLSLVIFSFFLSFARVGETLLLFGGSFLVFFWGRARPRFFFFFVAVFPGGAFSPLSFPLPCTGGIHCPSFLRARFLVFPQRPFSLDHQKVRSRTGPFFTFVGVRLFSPATPFSLIYAIGFY